VSETVTDCVEVNVPAAGEKVGVAAVLVALLTTAWMPKVCTWAPVESLAVISRL
jgi:hypothetical protein